MSLRPAACPHPGIAGPAHTKRFARRSTLISRIAQADPDMLIAIARLLASSLSLVSVYLDPTSPRANVTETYSVLCAYVLISIAFLALPAPPQWREKSRIVQTAVDILTLGVLAHFSDDLQSPFFAFFTFTLISATMRWGWRGVLATAMSLQILLLVIAIPEMRKTGDWALNLLLMRFVYAWVATLMLGFFASYRTRNERRLRELAAWPVHILPDDNRPWLTEALQHAASVLGTDHIVVVWQDQDEETATIAFWTGERCEFIDRVALFTSLADMKGVAATKPHEMLHRLGSSQTSAAWRRIVDSARHSMHLTEFKGIRYEGLVIVVDPQFREENVEAFSRIIGSRIALALEQFSIAHSLAVTASLNERVRVMRDIHDSVLQDLTAAIWQLDATRAGLPIDAQPAIGRIRDLLQHQHSRLRTLVNGTRARGDTPRRLRQQLMTLVEPLEAQWGCRLEVSVEPEDLQVHDETASELCLALSEATANAVRHGAAATLKVGVRAHRGDLLVEIVDDGCGLAGRTALPLSLRERMADLGGMLAAADSAQGCRLQLTFPARVGA